MRKIIKLCDAFIFKLLSIILYFIYLQSHKSIESLLRHSLYYIFNFVLYYLDLAKISYVILLKKKLLESESFTKKLAFYNVNNFFLTIKNYIILTFC